ncbi:MAG: imidazolonepropionase [Thermoplasmata archaeon]|nr:imidazolonepropionase [Thermoplasmata archaeon]
MIRADLLLTHIGELATLDRGPVPRCGPAMSELGLQTEAAVAVDGGRIVWIGPTRKARSAVRLRRGGRTHDLEGRLVVPGFVDAHTHLLFAGDRHREIGRKLRGESYRSIAASGGGIFSTVRATRKASSAQLLRDARGRLARLRRHGTTTVEIKTGYALEPRGELRLLRLLRQLQATEPMTIVPTYLGAHAVPREARGRATAYVDEIVRHSLPTIASAHLARFCDVFCEPGFFSVPAARRILRAAQQLGLGTKIHADEFVASGGGRLAAEIGAVSAEHLLQTPAADRQRLAKAGVVAVLLPLTPFATLVDRPVPGREFVRAGVAVALGTDLSPNSYVESMPLVIAHAVHSARLTPEEALTASTVNAAHALRLADGSGRITVGGPADLAVFDLHHAAEIAGRIGVDPVEVYRQGKFVFTSELRQ